MHTLLRPGFLMTVTMATMMDTRGVSIQLQLRPFLTVHTRLASSKHAAFKRSRLLWLRLLQTAGMHACLHVARSISSHACARIYVARQHATERRRLNQGGGGVCCPGKKETVLDKEFNHQHWIDVPLSAQGGVQTSERQCTHACIHLCMCGTL